MILFCNLMSWQDTSRILYNF